MRKKNTQLVGAPAVVLHGLVRSVTHEIQWTSSAVGDKWQHYEDCTSWRHAKKRREECQAREPHIKFIAVKIVRTLIAPNVAMSDCAGDKLES